MTLAGRLAGSLAGSLAGGLAGGGSSTPPPTVNAGTDASFDMLSASPHTHDGSGDASSYLWTKISGPGTPTWADNTSPTSTVKFDADGVYVLDLAGTGPGGTTHDQVTITVTATQSALLTRMQSAGRTCIFYEVGFEETVTTGLYDGLGDLGPAGIDQAQTLAARPSKVAGGGPNGKDGMVFQDAARFMINTAVAIAGGKNLYIGGVLKSAAALSNQFCIHNNNNPDLATKSALFGAQTAGGNKFFVTSGTNSGANQNCALTSPAHHTNWFRWDHRFAAGVVPVSRINGAAVSPLFTTPTGAAFAVESIVLGRYGGFSSGGFYLGYAFEDVGTAAGTACLGEQDAIDYYIGKQTAVFF